MCIILSCNPNERPTSACITNCWNRNPDGAGFMWADGTTVHGRKGLMTLEDLNAALTEVPDDVPLVIHFRIGTSGGLSESVTHPYPVSSDLSDLHAVSWESPLGIAHNGVLHGIKTDADNGVSDTVAYIRDVVTPLSQDVGLFTAEGLKTLRETSVGSRLCIMNGEGMVMLTGSGWNTVSEGIQASNESWHGYTYQRRYTASWDDYYEGISSYSATDDLPKRCRRCMAHRDCAIGVPACRGVATYVGYSLADYQEYWSEDYEIAEVC